MSLVLVVALFSASAARARTAPTADNRYGHMHMKYEKTWLGVDVANVDVTFDGATRDRIRELAAGQSYSDAVAEHIARAALDANNVNVQVRLLRNAPLIQFLDAAHKNLEHARDAGYISQDTFAIAWGNVQRSFAPLADRGFKKGDLITYQAGPGSLQTTAVAGDHTLLDVSTQDEGARRAMIASYFAPKSDFRTKLIKDVFE
jgi:hypothetical protein